MRYSDCNEESTDAEVPESFTSITIALSDACTKANGHANNKSADRASKISRFMALLWVRRAAFFPSSEVLLQCAVSGNSIATDWAASLQHGRKAVHKSSDQQLHIGGWKICIDILRGCRQDSLNCFGILVPGGGVEPPRPEGRRILSPLRLPVPPSRQKGIFRLAHGPKPPKPHNFVNLPAKPPSAGEFASAVFLVCRLELCS